jgi:hypothetical protein
MNSLSHRGSLLRCELLSGDPDDTKVWERFGTARTDDGRLDIKLSSAVVSSILIFTASWKKWFCVLRHRKGFGLFDSVRFGLWLTRSEAGATPGQGLADEVHMSA